MTVSAFVRDDARRAFDVLKAGGIAIVSTHVPLKTKFTKQLTLGLERAA